MHSFGISAQWIASKGFSDDPTFHHKLKNLENFLEKNKTAIPGIQIKPKTLVVDFEPEILSPKILSASLQVHERILSWLEEAFPLQLQKEKKRGKEEKDYEEYKEEQERIALGLLHICLQQEKEKKYNYHTPSELKELLLLFHSTVSPKAYNEFLAQFQRPHHQTSLKQYNAEIRRYELLTPTLESVEDLIQRFRFFTSYSSSSSPSFASQKNQNGCESLNRLRQMLGEWKIQHYMKTKQVWSSRFSLDGCKSRQSAFQRRKE